MKITYTWEEFEGTWKDQFNEVISAIRLVNLYLERLHQIYLGDLLNHDELYHNQKEWIQLYNRFDPCFYSQVVWISENW